MENKDKSSDEKIKEIIRKLDWKAFWIGLIGVAVLIAFPVWIADHFWFDYSKTGTFGDTIGGITAPIIGLISALLIYLSFRAQIKANYIVQSQIEKQENSEKEKKEIEFISNLMQHFREEINEFSLSGYEGAVGNRQYVLYKGTEALKNHLTDIQSNTDSFNESEIRFFNNSKNQQYLGLLDILDKLIEIIRKSNLKVSDKEYFKSQIRYLFDYKLTLSPSQEIYPCSVCGDRHIQLPCVLHKRITLIEAKIDFLEYLES